MSDGRYRDAEERPLTERELRDWEVMEPEVHASLRAVLSVRFTEREFRRLREAARSSGSSMGDVVRQAVRNLLSERQVIVPAVTGWSGGDANILAKSGQATYGQGQTFPELRAAG